MRTGRWTLLERKPTIESQRTGEKDMRINVENYKETDEGKGMNNNIDDYKERIGSESKTGRMYQDSTTGRTGRRMTN